MYRAMPNLQLGGFTWTRAAIAASVVVFFLLTIVFIDREHDEPWEPGSPYGRPPPPPPPPHSSQFLKGDAFFPAVIRELMAPMRYEIDAPSFTTIRGETYTLDGEPLWTKPIGKRLAIVDIDTRPLNESHQALNAERFIYGQHGYTSTGMLNHWLYAMIHGYDYHLIRTPVFDDRVPPWTKIPALSDHLQNYDMVISIDADALFTHLNLPFEWLLNRWKVPHGASLTMARDPIAPQNMDRQGRVFNNAGFIIAQNNPRTHEILRTWASCPDDLERFPGCDELKMNWPAEQAAFGEYIRYVFNGTMDLHEIECTEGNGWLGSDSGCDGVFVEHMWSAKDQVHRVVGETVAQAVLARAHKDFVDRAEEMVLVRESNDFLRKQPPPGSSWTLW